MTFDEAFEILLEHEGGFSDHKADPGGKTKFGVTEAVAREVGYRGSMADLPLSLAKRIYKDKYWDAVQAEKLPAQVRYAVFDAAVNSGVRQAARWLQRAAGVSDDGIIGTQTLAAANSMDGQALLRKMLAQRLKFMTDLDTWQSFGRGWARRIASVLGE